MLMAGDGTEFPITWEYFSNFSPEALESYNFKQLFIIGRVFSKIGSRIVNVSELFVYIDAAWV